MGYGRADASYGAVFPYVFTLPATYWAQADALIKYVAAQDGGFGKLKGEKIALVYHDSAYGKEPITTLEGLAQKHGYTFLKFAVSPPGIDQKATWLQIRQQRPNWVFMWGWGVMNSTAIKEAIAVGYPRLQMYGVWWAGAEPDVLPAERAAKGYNALALEHSAEHGKVHEDILKYVYDKGQGTGKKEEVGQVLYNRGMLNAMLVVEAVRTAQGKFGKKPLTGEEVRWGVEHLNIDNARIKALGVEGMIQPLKTSCEDHEGAHKARIHTWDGTQWSYTSEWYEADSKLLRPMVEAAAKKYAAEKNITPRDCGKEG